ncbi:MAG TPA: ATP-binding protein [Gemmatimonadaceae bacterium]
MTPAEHIRTRVTVEDASLSSSQSLGDSCAPSGHAVQFYEDDRFLTRAIADYLAAGLAAGEPVIVIATRAHRDAFWNRLRLLGVDVALALRSGRLVWLDASETLTAIMHGRMPSAQRFHSVLGTMIARHVNANGRGTARLYGEMVDLLWQGGNRAGAVRLEALWNELASRHTFWLLCAYAMAHFTGEQDRQHFESICHQHTHVIPTERYMQADAEEQLLQIALLQQRANALETEIVRREALERQLRDALRERHDAAEALRESAEQLRTALAEREAVLQREQQARTDAESANRAKSAFLAAMSHELRTPLNAIGGYVQLVEMGVHGPVTDAQREALRRAQRGQQHLLMLISDILNFAKLEAGRVEYRLRDVPLADVVAEIAPMVAPPFAAKGIAYEVHIPAHTTVCADREKLQQILLNLLANAVKFTSAGGRVTVDTASRDGAPEGTVFLRVADTGCGIPREHHDVIFDPFVQVPARLIRTQDGTGLGLSISRDLARGMGGELRVRSVEGKGATFTLMLRLLCPAAREARDRAGADGVRG